MTLDVNAIARKAKDILARCRRAKSESMPSTLESTYDCKSLRARILLKGDNIYPYYIQVF